MINQIQNLKKRSSEVRPPLRISLSEVRPPTGSKGFTIIETLVAVAVMMIAIAGPLVVAHKGLTAALDAKDYMIASFLAQESMEVIRWAVNNDPQLGDLGIEWLTIGEYPNDKPLASHCIGSDKNCEASVLSLMDHTLPANAFIYNCSNVICKLYLDNSKRGYTNVSGAGAGGNTPTQFSRKFYLEEVASNIEYRVRVIVSWNRGTVPHRVELVSQLVNVRR